MECVGLQLLGYIEKSSLLIIYAELKVCNVYTPVVIMYNIYHIIDMIFLLY